MLGRLVQTGLKLTTEGRESGVGAGMGVIERVAAIVVTLGGRCAVELRAGGGAAVNFLLGGRRVVQFGRGHRELVNGNDGAYVIDSEFTMRN